MWSYWWSIPGPRHFVAEIVASLRAGRQAVVLLPAHGPPGLAAAVASVVEQDDGWVWSRVPVTAGHHGADAIRHALLGGAAPGTLADLVAHPTLQGRVLWIEGLTADTWPAWAPFIRAFAAAAAARPILDRPLLVLCVTGLATAAWPDAHPNLSVCPWYDRLDDLDMQQWAAYLLRPLTLTPVERRLRRELLVALAGHDPCCAQALSTGSLEQLLDPQALLTTLAAERGWLDPAPRPATWATGVCDRIGGQEQVHLAALCQAVDYTAHSEERLWRAQVTVFFPLIEQLRKRLVARYGKRLRLPITLADGRVITQPEELEIGQLNFLLSTAPISWHRSELLTRLHAVRNALAHLTPLPYRELKELLLTIERNDLGG